MKQAGAQGHPVGHAVLQQADAGRPLPALRRDRREAGLPIIVYNVPGRTGCNIDARRSCAFPALDRRRQGSLRQHHPDFRGVPRCAREFPRAVRRRPADLAVHVGRGARRGFGGRQRSPAEMARMVKRPSERLCGRTTPPHASPAAPARQLRRIESNPGEAGDGHAWPSRPVLSSAAGVSPPGFARADPRGAR